MTPNQSGLKPNGSAEPFKLGADFTGKADRLAVLSHDTGAPELIEVAAIGDEAFYQLLEDGADGDIADAKPLVNGEVRRFVLKGTCNPGDNGSLADPATAADKGKVRKVPATAGTYRPFIKFEEAGVDGQLVKARVFLGLPSVTIP